MAGQSEYQFWATLTPLGAKLSYCYRIVQAGVDLLGSDQSPSFTSFQQAGTPSSFSFAVFGDWGDVGSTGTNSDEANVLAQVVKSGPNFMVTTGDNSYPGGSQTNYGDLVHGGDSTSGVFGSNYWPRVGKGIAAFLPMGNHGMSGGSTHLLNWPETATVAASNGTYQLQTYCCLDGTRSASYPSAWYAFDYGQARFYVLQAAWANSNTGTGSLYQDDYDYHWTRESQEYQWLAADLGAHSTQLKFAFFHFPLHGDSSSEGTDPYLDGANMLEGLLATNGVNIVFNGHTHVYERNRPQVGSLVSYVTGGGGSRLEPLSSKCSAFAAYAIGWSYSRNAGSGCGAAAPPTSIAQVFHFLLVRVTWDPAMGSQVTVVPTDENGNTFDVQSYQLGRSAGS